MKSITVDSVDIPFDAGWAKIAVSLSGGADSALLTYLLCRHVEQTKLQIEVHLISHVRCWKTKPWQAEDFENVRRYLIDKFPTIKFELHTGFVAPDLEWGEKGPTITDEYGKLVSGDNIQIRSYAEYICCANYIDAYYNAVTKNPSSVDFKGMPTRDIEPTESNQHLRIMKHLGKWALHPFRFVEKDWVYRQYRRENLLDLWNLTRSCEGTFDHINYENYHKGMKVPTCGKCFWCKEREWAIEQYQ